jgi:hypothetical protein
MTLKNDREQDPGDCECTFFWVNLDRAPNEWLRLADYAMGNMNDYDSDSGPGDGKMKFSRGAQFDFWLPEGDSFTVRANGYDQDCADDLFGSIAIDELSLATCYKVGTGENDPLGPAEQTFRAPRTQEVVVPGTRESYDTSGRKVNVTDYTLTLRIERLATIIDNRSR